MKQTLFIIIMVMLTQISNAQIIRPDRPAGLKEAHYASIKKRLKQYEESNKEKDDPAYIRQVYEDAKTALPDYWVRPEDCNTPEGIKMLKDLEEKGVANEIPPPTPEECLRKDEIRWMEGIIIYPDEDKLPQDIIFYPGKNKDNLPFPEFVSRTLKKEGNAGLGLIFITLRNFACTTKDMLITSPYIKAGISLPNNLIGTSTVRITYGAFYYIANKPINPLLRKERFVIQPKQVTVSLNGIDYEGTGKVHTTKVASEYLYLFPSGYADVFRTMPVYFSLNGAIHKSVIHNIQDMLPHPRLYEPLEIK